MRILKIEIDGFKSYGQPQCLDKLDAQFNAITGLNGSGKSNILDSICFLLGISNLQYVRAESNEDLVFKKGQGGITRAMVTITFDNSDPKHCAPGYENQKTIIVRRQIILNGKQSYHINNMPASNAKVSDLFNSCSMNVNNPHFLIMQGRVTKVLNMKPREILLMIEEAAGVRVYENKRRNAMNTIDKKNLKIENMNKMMDEQIMPRLEKLRSERELYNEYQKLGRDIESQEKLLHCFEFFKIDRDAKKTREAITELIKENEEDRGLINQVEDQLRVESNTLKDMKDLLETDLKERHDQLQDQRKKKNDEFTARELELNRKKEELKELDSAISTKRKDLDQDKERLKKKKDELTTVENSHGDKAKQFEEAKQKVQLCKDALSALDRGLVIGEEGEAISIQQQILDFKTKYGQERTKELRIQSTLDDSRPKLADFQKQLTQLSRNSSSSLDLQLQNHQKDMEKIQSDLQKFANLNQNRDELNQKRRNVFNEIQQINDKAQNIFSRYPFLNFEYKPIMNFNNADVIGPFARLIRPKRPEYALPLEIALGGILTNVVVRTSEAGTRLLKHGQLERRVTFIPLDKLKYTPLDPRQFTRAVEVAGGEDYVMRAIDLIDFDESNRQAVEYALGRIFICPGPNEAEKVCFDVNVRVITLDGDDYRPDGFLSGGSTQRRASVLMDLDSIKGIEMKTNKLNSDLKELDRNLIEIQRQLESKEQLEVKQAELLNRIREIQDRIRLDPTSRLRDNVTRLKNEIEKNERLLSEIRPKVIELAEKLKIAEERQKNETAYRNNERQRIEKELKEAETTLRSLETNASNAIQQLELDRLNIQTMEKQIIDDEADLMKSEEERSKFVGDCDGIQVFVNDFKRQLDEIKATFDEFMVEYRNHEKETRLKSEQVDKLKKELRKKQQNAETFEPKKREMTKCAEDLEKQARLIEQQHSWISEDKEQFNRPGTIYDFRNLTKRDIEHQIRSKKDRRKDLEGRVNVDAMRTLGEEEERATDLDSKRKALEADRDLLYKTIFEIDEEKKAELRKSYCKISRDFGGIFSTILPGANSKLQAVNEEDLTEGLQIKIAFNDQWKESLDELSGGQRSLVALSLILAMLKCNPAPIYILDEVDAALDLSHTANIGTMIKQHFKESQFIIVSLKEGMFNNANVIYRTQFVNGSSKVTRTANH